jgi:hypothetical protein
VQQRSQQGKAAALARDERPVWSLGLNVGHNGHTGAWAPSGTAHYVTNGRGHTLRCPVACMT